MDFISAMVARDLETGKYDGRVVTRFPPEPNGYLHIGHAKSLCLNFGLAQRHPGGRCHLRLDDTNPDTEKAEFVEAMKRDIRWLGFDWGEHLYHASDYFEQLYRYARVLIDKGLAYVDSSTGDEIRERRGSVTEPGVNSPWRDRSVEENRDLFERMRAGEFPDGSHVLRARIDMAHHNMVMRDPVLYRIRHARHYRQGDAWPIYPMYDFAHCLSDSIERVTHSLCTLEFENNREIYDWLLEKVDAPRPRPEQTEFAPLVLDHVITSKSRLRPLVEGGKVRGWDDPRMPTLAGLRRRGVRPRAVRALCEMVGVARAHARVDMAKLDFAIRDDLEPWAPRAFCVLDPLKVVLTNYPEGEGEVFEAPVLPGRGGGAAGAGSGLAGDAGSGAGSGAAGDAGSGAEGAGDGGPRRLRFRREIVVDRSDFEEDPPPGFHRLAPGREVRLKYAYVIRCDEVVRDEGGRVVELRCRVDHDTRGGRRPQGRRVRGAIHWLDPRSAVRAEVRLYDRLFADPDPPLDDLVGALQPASERVVTDALVEAGVAGTPPGRHFQFERTGYFYTDPVDSGGGGGSGGLVFNRTVTLRDTWAARRDRPGKRAASASSSRDAPAPTRPRDTLRNPEERERFRELASLGAAEAPAVSLVRSPRLRELFLESRDACPEAAASIAAWLANDVARIVAADSGASLERLDPGALAELARAVDQGDLSHRQGRRVLEALLRQGGAFADARDGLDLDEIDDDEALRSILEALLDQHPDKAAAYRAGKTGLLSFFVGQTMRQTRGRADPRKASGIARRLLEEHSA